MFLVIHTTVGHILKIMIAIRISAIHTLFVNKLVHAKSHILAQQLVLVQKMFVITKLFAQTTEIVLQLALLFQGAIEKEKPILVLGLVREQFQNIQWCNTGELVSTLVREQCMTHAINNVQFMIIGVPTRILCGISRKLKFFQKETISMFVDQTSQQLQE